MGNRELVQRVLEVGVIALSETYRNGVVSRPRTPGVVLAVWPDVPTIVLATERLW